MALRTPPKTARLGPSPARAPPPRCAARGGPREKSRLPSPAAPRTSRSRPANWPRTRPIRAARPPASESPQPRVGTGAPGSRPPHTPGALPPPQGPLPRHPPTGQLAAVRGKGGNPRKTRKHPQGRPLRGPGRSRRCWPAPREPPPLQAPGAAGPVDGRVFICTNLAKDRADAQRLVATRLLDRVHDPLGHFSRLQRIHPRAR